MDALPPVRPALGSRPSTPCGLATASLILGVIGLVALGPLAGIPAILCGAVALDRIGKARGGLGGHGRALAGLVTGALSFVTGIVLILSLLVYPALQQARSHARRVSDTANLKQLCLGLLMYAQDYDQRLPADLGLVLPYIRNGKVFVVASSGTPPPTSPADVTAGRCDYLYFGSGLSLSDIRQPQQTPVLMTKPGLLARGWVNVGYADGHVAGAAGVPADVQRVMDSPPPVVAAGAPPVPIAVAVPAAVPGLIGVPLLEQPQADAVFDNGRNDRNEDIVWEFDWSDVAGAERYQLFVMRAQARLPVINLDSLTESSYRHQQKGVYIGDPDRSGWTWKVRAGIGANWGDWSEARGFSVEAVDTDPPPE